MITFTQITKSKDLAALTDYYVLDVRTTGPDPSTNAITSVSMLQIEDLEVLKEAVVRLSPETDLGDALEEGYFREEQTADSLARILIGQTLVSEPLTLQFLRVFLERFEYEGEIFFVPIGKLACSVFRDLNPGSIPELARQMEIPELDNAGLLRTAYFENEIFLKCRAAMGGKIRRSAKAMRSDRSKKASKKKRISDRTLIRWAESIWSVSPWVLVAAAFLVVFFVILNIPKKKDATVDRNKPPVSYLVLSWDQTGKYGTQTRARSGEDAVIQFRIPYGVYNVLNNNSIPVELYIVTDEKARTASDQSADDEDAVETNEAASDSGNEAVTETEKASAPTVQELSVGSGGQEEDFGLTKVTMRPNSNRQIIVDTDQYVTLSEDAKDLIFFYVSEVPEERESDTTGSDSDSGRVVYAYVKGTEVRFRKSPSLEGAIIDSMQNGQQVQVLGITGEWTHVQVQGDKGYIFSQFLTSEDPQAAAYAEKMAAAQATEDGTSGSTETVDQSQEATGDQSPADTADSTDTTQEETMAVESSTENTGLVTGSAQGEM